MGEKNCVVETYEATIGMTTFQVKSVTPLHAENALSKKQINDALYRIFAKYYS